MKKSILLGAVGIASVVSVVLFNLNNPNSSRQIELTDTVSGSAFETSNTTPNTNGNEQQIIINQLAFQNKLLQEQLTLLQEQVDTMQQSVNQTSSESVVKSDSSMTKPGPESSLSEQKEMEKMNQQMQQQVAVIEQAMGVEDIDPKWSSEAQQNIQRQLQQDELASLQLENMDCRSTVCKLEINTDQSLEPEARFQSLRLIEWEGPGFAHFDQDTGKATMYLAKIGHELPVVEQD